MASLHRDPRSPKGVWYCAYMDAQGRRVFRSTGKRSKQEARLVCETWDAAERAAADGSLSTNRGAQIINEMLRRSGLEPVTRYRLGEWFSEWLGTKTACSPQIQKRYTFAQAKFLEFLGTGAPSRFLDSVNEGDIRRFAAYLAGEGRCAATVNRIIRADLGNAFNRAVRLGKIRFNPIAAVEPQKDQGAKDQGTLEERKTFTPQQIAKLIETSRGTDWEGAILFGYTTGARLQDVANLRWSAIDPEARVVVFRQRKTARRTGRKTVVGLHPDFEDWLLRQSAPDDPLGFVFPTLANQSPGGKKGLTNQFNNLVIRSGIDAGLIRKRRGLHGRSRRNLSFHSLRHTAASNVFNSALIKEVARRLTDHSKNGSLERYLHHDLTAIRNTTALIPRLPL